MRIDVQLLGYAKAARQKSPTTSEVDQLTVVNAHIYSDEVVDVLADMLLHCVASINVSANLAEDLVPRPPSLSVQVAAQRVQVLVQAAIPIPGTRTQSCWTIKVVAQSSGGCVASFPAARTLEDYFVHIFAHGSLSLGMTTIYNREKWLAKARCPSL